MIKILDKQTTNKSKITQKDTNVIDQKKVNILTKPNKKITLLNFLESQVEKVKGLYLNDDIAKDLIVRYRTLTDVESIIKKEKNNLKGVLLKKLSSKSEKKMEFELENNKYVCQIESKVTKTVDVESMPKSKQKDLEKLNKELEKLQTSISDLKEVVDELTKNYMVEKESEYIKVYTTKL